MSVKQSFPWRTFGEEEPQASDCWTFSPACLLLELMRSSCSAVSFNLLMLLMEVSSELLASLSLVEQRDYCSAASPGGFYTAKSLLSRVPAVGLVSASAAPALTPGGPCGQRGAKAAFLLCRYLILLAFSSGCSCDHTHHDSWCKDKECILFLCSFWEFSGELLTSCALCAWSWSKLSYTVHKM